MKHKTTSISLQSLNSILGFGWFTGLSSIKKDKNRAHGFIKSEKYNQSIKIK